MVCAAHSRAEASFHGSLRRLQASRFSLLLMQSLMMSPRHTILLLSLLGAWHARSQSPTLQQFGPVIKPLVNQYCVKCHGGEQTKGDVNLKEYEKTSQALKDIRVWKTVAEQLKSGDMPPDDAPQPTEAEKTQLKAWTALLVTSVENGSLGKDPGRTTARRLNRTEYNNTIQELFGVRIRPADSFPADGSGGAGFDNNADTLFLPPVLMEKLFDAAGQVLDAVFAAEPLKNRLLGVRPENGKPAEPAAKLVIGTWAPRIFRRKTDEAELEPYLALWRKATSGGASYEDGIKAAFKSLLISPNFLFRLEKNQPGTVPYRVSDFELANRLSYFLWSSMPDLELLGTAARGELSKPDVFEAQVKRLMKDPRARNFSREFSSQWLGFDRLRSVVNPDKTRFPEFTQSLRVSMFQETVEFFHSVLQENKSLLTLVDADYTFLNEELARHYGIAGVTGPELRKVSLTNKNRGGVLGMGSVLACTSLPLRTSPVLRGKWVLEEILGTPPPPPPQNAGTLPADDRHPDGLTFRQRLEEHRKKASCSGCHAKLDPPGFGLENFDPIGRWRTEIAGKPVDSGGKLTTGEEFSTPAELKAVLLKKKHLVMRNLVERTLAYSLGRGLEFYDEPTIVQITQKLLASDCRAEVLLMEVAKSFPFQFRRNEPIAKVE